MATPTAITTPLGDWCERDDVFQCRGCTGLDIPDSIVDSAIIAATAILYRLTGSQYPGQIIDVVRPTAAEPLFFNQTPTTIRDERLRVEVAAASGRYPGVVCLPEVLLGGSPIISITSVWVDGALLPSSAYTVFDRRWLARIDGDGWPMYQDLRGTNTDPDTFEVTYVYGRVPTEDLKLAASMFACELAKLLSDLGTCQIPERLSSKTRQGNTVTFIDPAEYLRERRTGIPFVDSVISSVNPDGLREAASVYSPDVNWPVHRRG